MYICYDFWYCNVALTYKLFYRFLMNLSLLFDSLKKIMNWAAIKTDRSVTSSLIIATLGIFSDLGTKFRGFTIYKWLAVLPQQSKCRHIFRIFFYFKCLNIGKYTLWNCIDAFRYTSHTYSMWIVRVWNANCKLWLLVAVDPHLSKATNQLFVLSQPHKTLWVI